ncbi:hypothetical protein ACRAWF_01980 [Streptomyces sp. L7]
MPSEQTGSDREIAEFVAALVRPAERARAGRGSCCPSSPTRRL